MTTTDDGTFQCRDCGDTYPASGAVGERCAVCDRVYVLRHPPEELGQSGAT